MDKWDMTVKLVMYICVNLRNKNFLYGKIGIYHEIPPTI